MPFLRVLKKHQRLFIRKLLAHSISSSQLVEVRDGMALSYDVDVVGEEPSGSMEKDSTISRGFLVFVR